MTPSAILRPPHRLLLLLLYRGRGKRKEGERGVRGTSALPTGGGGRWRERIPPRAQRIRPSVDEPRRVIQWWRSSLIRLGAREGAGDERDDGTVLSLH